MSSAVALARRVQPFLARPQSGCMQEAVRARKTRLCGGAPLGDGGSRSRAAARYSSAASLHGAECLALTDST